MRTLIVVLATGLCGVVSAQEVFTNGIDVNGQAVQGVGLIAISSNNPAWTGQAPALGQLAGVDSNGNDIAEGYLVPLRPAWLETNGIYARKSNGLALYDESSNAVLVIRSGQLLGTGGLLSNFTISASAITGGQLAVAVLPTGSSGVWNAGGLVITNAQLRGDGSQLTGLTPAQVGVNYPRFCS
jgi:hypothetical protein